MKKFRGFLKKNHRLHKAHQDDTSAAYNNIVQSRLRGMQDSWLSKAEEIQSLADRKDMKKFHDAPRQFMVQRALDPTHFPVQLAAHFWQIKCWA